VVDSTRVAMRSQEGGWWWAEVRGEHLDTDYAFLLDGSDEEIPDPRSRHQPHGVHGRSRTVDLSGFPWTDRGWRGIPLAGSVLYELHVGTFTPEGTFDAAIGKLAHLADLGVDAVELLPCNAFPGERGWGYDGVGLYAVHEPYGGPSALARLVNAAHAYDIAVVMDVVYNHLGPDGNYLKRFGPYFTSTHATPWGPAVNLDAPLSDEVRAFLLDNLRMWVLDYHVDGIRLDAVHALRDDRAVHILEELATEVEVLSAHVGKPLFLIAETDANNPLLIRAREAGGFGQDAQWCDDVHHALHAALTGERQGYYCDFGSMATLAKAMTNAYVHDGSWSTFRGRSHGRRPHGLPGSRFVTFLQNHDQVGNRAQGDRLSQLVSPGLLRVGAALLLTSPFVPMLFMGEEWGARTPWQFFSSFASDELAEAVRAGRSAEFAAFGWEPGDIPDPQDPETARRSTLDWSEPEREPQASLLAWYRWLIRLRKAWPELNDGRRDLVRCAYDDGARWFVMHRGRISVACNFADTMLDVPMPGAQDCDVLLASGDPTVGGSVVTLGPESVALLVRP